KRVTINPLPLTLATAVPFVAKQPPAGCRSARWQSSGHASPPILNLAPKRTCRSTRRQRLVMQQKKRPAARRDKRTSERHRFEGASDSRLRILKDYSLLHDKQDVVHGADVVERVAFDGYDV